MIFLQWLKMLLGIVAFLGIEYILCLPIGRLGEEAGRETVDDIWNKEGEK